MCIALDRLKSLRVEDVMCREVVELRPGQPLREVAVQFATHHISSAPVVDEKRRCVGMLSASDFTRPVQDACEADSGDTLVDCQASVAEYMTEAVVAVAPQQSLLTAAGIMSSGHVHHLPVIDATRVVGVVSTMDIVASLLNAIDEMEVAHRGC